MRKGDRMPAEPSEEARCDYHLDIDMRDGCLRVKVEGDSGPAVLDHVLEVTEAAARCGMPIVVTGGGTTLGMLA
jgi:hypothetical protein